MDHEVFVPVPVEAVREVLRDRVRLARCVPGLQRDAADAADGPLTGRLKVRAGNHSITYRGTLDVVEDGEGFTVTGEGAEARGGGSVSCSLKIRPIPSADDAKHGTKLLLNGVVQAAGRLAGLPEGVAGQTARRLLDRCAARLAEVAIEASPAPDATAEAPGPVSVADAERRGLVGEDEPAATEETAAGTAEPTMGNGGVAEGGDDSVSGVTWAGAPNGPGTDPGTGASGPAGADGADGAAKDPQAAEGSVAPGAPGQRGGAPDDSSAEGRRSGGAVFETPVPPPSLGPDSETDFEEGELGDEPDFADFTDLSGLTDAYGDGVDGGVDDGVDDGADEVVGEGGQGADPFGALPGEPPSEAAHARRTMIGRSAEEVDHAPPRGRYAPTPAPNEGGPVLPVRWLAPAAALALVSAVVVRRALRRRM
ncbi:SRPBCC domain-containing protein [Streptomyces sp. NPDC057638]|uniref:SRPBCC domain-containing protein n=1 Tax=Streptomyces sp. NPDC057638 TaxID=3346190 RepID=UPI0036AF2D5E